MVSAKNVVDVVLWPSRRVDDYVLAQGGNLLKKVPAVWSRIPQKVKDQLKDQESPTRRTLDSIVTVGVPLGVLAVVDNVAGRAFDPYKAFGSWYVNNPPLAAGVTAAAATAIVNVTNRAWHYIPDTLHVDLPKVGRTAYTTIAGTGIAAVLFAYALTGPSGPATQPVAVAPAPTPAPTATPTPTVTPTPTLEAVVVTATPAPTSVPATPTSIPSPTPPPTTTPTPAPTATPAPTPTSIPTRVPATPTPRPTATSQPERVLYNGCTTKEQTPSRPQTPYYSVSPRERVIDVTTTLLPQIKSATGATQAQASQLEKIMADSKKQGNELLVLFAPNVTSGCTDLGLVAKVQGKQDIVSGIYLRLSKQAADRLASNYGMPAQLSPLTK